MKNKKKQEKEACLGAAILTVIEESLLLFFFFGMWEMKEKKGTKISRKEKEEVNEKWTQARREKKKQA